MNMAKFSLYAALAVISYLMLLAWNEDYPQVVDFGAPAPSPVPVISPPENTAVTDIPTQLPDSPAAPPPNESVTVSEPTANISSTNVISVSTDTLEIDIDLIDTNQKTSPVKKLCGIPSIFS